METVRIPSIMLEVSAFELVQLRERMRELVLLDVRNANEIKEGVIPGSYHISLAQLLERMHQPPITALDRPVAVYCRSGKRSLTACRLLSEEGYQRLYSLGGGIEAYLEAGLPIEKLHEL